MSKMDAKYCCVQYGARIRELEMKGLLHYQQSSYCSSGTDVDQSYICLTLFRLIGYAILINWISPFLFKGFQCKFSFLFYI